LDHKTHAAGESADPWVTATVLGNHISFFLNMGGIKISFNQICRSSEKAFFPILGVNGIPKKPHIALYPLLMYPWI
jgi:hypothetical protein